MSRSIGEQTIPFTPLRKPLSACKVGLVTASEMAIRGEPDRWAAGDVARDVYALPMDTPGERLCSRKEAYRELKAAKELGFSCSVTYTAS